MLNNWLRSCDLEERNWRDVAKALRQIEHHQLAKEIDKTGHSLHNSMLVIISNNNMPKIINAEIIIIDLVSKSDVALHQPELDPSVVNECPPPIPPKKIQCHNFSEDSKCHQVCGMALNYIVINICSH